MDYRDNPNHKPREGQIWTPIEGQLSLPIDRQGDNQPFTTRQIIVSHERFKVICALGRAESLG
jgi:hypothetical protein